mmetsp:Transcript_13208/g.16448  ORF Transcript_13208/g.16448 Transcript_13208/m.16448 type:complete len:103 (+) Transcript_13208:339-647(+)
MCPLRYIVLAVSALVALIVLLWPYGEEKDVHMLLKDEDEKDEKKQETRAIDFLTGRYLYEKYKLYRRHQHIKSSTLQLGVKPKSNNGHVMQGALSLIGSSPQ